MGKKTRKLSLMGRRRFIKTLSTLGLSSVTLNYISKESLAEQSDNLDDEVPYVKFLATNNPDANYADADESGRAPVYETIPYDKWVDIQTTHDAAAKINSLLASITASNLVRASVRSIVSGQHRKQVVNVRWTTLKLIVESSTQNPSEQPNQRTKEVSPEVPFDAVVEQIPDTVVGYTSNGNESREIEVRITKETKIQQAKYFKSKYRPVPAGCKMTKGGNTHEGTLGTPAYSRDRDDHGFVTAGHLFTDTDQRAHQPHEPFGGGNRIGYSDERVEETYHDSAFIRRDSEDLYTYDVAKDGGGTEEWPIDGIVTWDHIKNKQPDNWGLTLQGWSSGRNSGDVYDTYSGDQTHEKTFSTRVDSLGGDSGGPHYKKTTDSSGNDWVYIAGIHGWGTEGVKNAEATAMEAVEGKLNVDVRSA